MLNFNLFCPFLSHTDFNGKYTKHGKKWEKIWEIKQKRNTWRNQKSDRFKKPRKKQSEKRKERSAEKQVRWLWGWDGGTYLTFLLGDFQNIVMYL